MPVGQHGPEATQGHSWHTYAQLRTPPIRADLLATNAICTCSVLEDYHIEPLIFKEDSVELGSLARRSCRYLSE